MSDTTVELTVIRFTVTQEHIDATQAEDVATFGTLAFANVRCPIERALGDGWIVDDESARYGEDGPDFRLSDEARDFVARFDATPFAFEPPDPFTGEVYR